MRFPSVKYNASQSSESTEIFKWFIVGKQIFKIARPIVIPIFHPPLSISITWKMRRAGLIKPLLRINNEKQRVWRKNYATQVVSGLEECSLDPKEYVDFKRQLRQLNLPHKDGHTCLQLECRLCDRNRQPVTNAQKGTDHGLLAYVNKRTGESTNYISQKKP